ncbi:hypothetical protein ACFLTB_07655 [Chloroflexota bacterium]
MIKSVVRCPNDMVVVFDEKGEQVPEYQGYYGNVRDCILQDTPPDTIFSYLHDREHEFKDIPREKW